MLPPQPQVLASPERALGKVEGRNTLALRKLAIALARGCIFGDEVLAQSSPSGRKGVQLSIAKMLEIKNIIRRRARSTSANEFEGVWSLCMLSISKTCQYLRSGRLRMNSVKL